MIEERIVLQEALRDRMKEHAGETYPRECCGLLFGTVTEDGAFVIRDIVRMENRVSDRSNTHYGMDPLELFVHEKEQREAGQDILGFYHSHPDHPAVASDEDIREMIPETVYLIVSVVNGTCEEWKAWIRGGDDNESSNIRNLEIFF